MADQKQQEEGELVAQFTAISGVDADRAKFFLESAAWNLEVREKGKRIYDYYCSSFYNNNYYYYNYLYAWKSN